MSDKNSLNYSNNQIELEANSRPFWARRLTSGIVDMLLIFFATILCYNLVLKTPLSNNLYRYHNEILEIRDAAKLDTGYGYAEEVEPGKQGSYLLHEPDEGHDYYYIVKNVANPSSELTNAYKQLLKENDDYKSIMFSYDVNNLALISLSVFVPELVFIFVVPICNKRRASVGQLIAGERLIRSRMNEPAGVLNLLGRLFFIFIIETVVPYLIVGMVGTLALPMILFALMLANKDHRMIHDYISLTRIIDNKTYVPDIEVDDED